MGRCGLQLLFWLPFGPSVTSWGRTQGLLPLCPAQSVLLILTSARWALLPLAGVPISYARLLYESRKSPPSASPTSLSLATAFLSDDYKPTAYWWEPLEMCRKLTLSNSLSTLTWGSLLSAAV